MKLYIKMLFVSTLFIVSLAACGTFQTLTLSEEGRKRTFAEFHYECDNASDFLSFPYMYSGTKKDLIFILYPYYCGWASDFDGCVSNACFISILPVIILDLPLSFLTDTLALPFTTYMQYKHGNMVDPPYFDIGDIHRKRGREDAAIEYYEKGLKILPKYYGDKYPDYIDDYFSKLADYYDRKGDYENAVFYYEMLLEVTLPTCHNIHPTNIDGYYYDIEEYYQKLGGAYFRSGNQKKADECFEKALEYCLKKESEKSDNQKKVDECFGQASEYYRRTAYFYFKSGNQGKADEYFEKALESCLKTEQSEKNAGRCFERVAEYYRWQGEICFKSGNQKKADECLEKALEYCLKIKSEKSDNHKNADECFKKASEYYQRIGENYVESGDQKKS